MSILEHNNTKNIIDKFIIYLHNTRILWIHLGIASALFVYILIELIFYDYILYPVTVITIIIIYLVGYITTLFIYQHQEPIISPSAFGILLQGFGIASMIAGVCASVKFNDIIDFIYMTPDQNISPVAYRKNLDTLKHALESIQSGMISMGVSIFAAVVVNFTGSVHENNTYPPDNSIDKLTYRTNLVLSNINFNVKCITDSFESLKNAILDLDTTTRQLDSATETLNKASGNIENAATHIQKSSDTISKTNENIIVSNNDLIASNQELSKTLTSTKELSQNLTNVSQNFSSTTTSANQLLITVKDLCGQVQLLNRDLGRLISTRPDEGADNEKK